MRILLHWRYLLPAMLQLTRHFGQAALYLRSRGLRDLRLPADKMPDAREIRRWRHYVYGSTFLGTVFCVLRGRPRNHPELVRFARLAALACFFDDLIDTAEVQDNPLSSGENDPEEFGRNADPSGRALHLLHQLYPTLPQADLAEFKTYLQRVFDLETAGRQQQQKQPGIEEVARLTAEKGAYSVLLFRRLLPEPLTDSERRALFELGSLIQLCDDIFDLWFDRRNGTVTLATMLAGENKLNQLNSRFDQQLDACIAAFRHIPGPATRTETAVRIVHFLAGTTRVCLRHYQHLQKKHGTLPLNDRRAMVVDMDRWKNRRRTAAEVLRPKGMSKIRRNAITPTQQ